ncbi:hypothetical protein [Chitinimonas naiadis]
MKYLERFEDCLINPTEADLLDRDPIMAFSFYLSGRVAVLSEVAAEIVEDLDVGYSGVSINGARIAHAEKLMWLWILGAYEVVRTMHQAKQCFTQPIAADLGQLKKQLATIRMPAAKMEKARSQVPVTSNRSASGWDFSKKDILVNDPDDSVNVSARALLAEFDRVFCGIKRADVLLSHQASYER